MKILYLLLIVLLGYAVMGIKESSTEGQLEGGIEGSIVVAKPVPGLEKERSNSSWGSYRQLYIIDIKRNICYPVPDTFFREDVIGCPMWTPDGEEIIFSVSHRTLREGTLYIISKKGTNRKKIYSGECRHESFHPDGKRIIFIKENAIWSMKIDGTDIKQLLNISNIKKGDTLIKHISYPSVSPDGKQILFEGSTVTEGGIFTIVIDTLEVAEIVTSKIVKVDEWTPRWSPDGRKIAFCNGEGVYIINTDGTGLKKITPDGPRLGAYSTPCWSSDGEKIMYNYYYSTDWPFYLWQNREEFHIINIDGTNDEMIRRCKDVDLSIGFDFDWRTPPLTPLD